MVASDFDGLDGYRTLAHEGQVSTKPYNYCFSSFPGFCLYCYIWHVCAIPTYRVYRLCDIPYWCRCCGWANLTLLYHGSLSPPYLQLSLRNLREASKQKSLSMWQIFMDSIPLPWRSAIPAPKRMQQRPRIARPVVDKTTG